MDRRVARCRFGAAGWALLVVVVATSCGSEGVDRPAAPAPPPVFDITMKEYTYAPSVGPDSIPAGRVNFELHNAGDLGHQPALIFVPDGFPPMAEQVRGDHRRPVRILANNVGVPAGVTSALAVDLEPGRRYAFLCLVQTPEGKQHSSLGMAWEFRTPGTADAAGQEPTTTTTPSTATTQLPATPDTTGGGPGQP